MKAGIGDRIVVPGRHVGDAVRTGTVVEVHSEDGTPPFVVQWDDGHSGVCCPGPETRIEHTASA